MSPRIVIVQRRLTHYRVAAFELLRRELAGRDIALDVLSGTGTAAEVSKQDAGELGWARPLPTRYFAGGRICWQPFDRHLAGADLVIVTQENKLIHNHLLLLRRRPYRLAFWGHGANLQSIRPRGLRERFKRWTTNRVDWWFAYTRLSAELVAAAGFPPQRITVVNNAVDTSQLRQQAAAVSAEELARLRAELAFGDAPVGVFVGSLYGDKRLDFLFEAMQRVRQRVADFRLLVVGDGPLRDPVRAWCAAHPWARWVGARHGAAKAAHLSLARVMLNPGLVGLGILDSFALGLPMVTTANARHSPEIAYLDDGINGWVTDDRLDDYADAVVALVRDDEHHARMRHACLASADQYTLPAMVGRFAEGIEAALRHGGH